MNELDMIYECARIIKERIDVTPTVGMILGSGLGEYAEKIENPIKIPYSDLPNFPVSTVHGHEGQFVVGTLHGKSVIAMQGRVHYYEGYSQREITLPIRIMKVLGVDYMVITNAAGGVNRNYKPGTLMLIRDHINFSGSHPLIGGNLEEFGARFPDLTTIYRKSLREQLKSTAKREGIHLEEGVYMMFSGPSYETPSEVIFAERFGADAVGMSTVPEAIVCAHCNIPVIGISCITNMGAGILDQPLDHSEVMETANMVKKDFIKVLDLILSEVI